MAKISRNQKISILVGLVEKAELVQNNRKLEEKATDLALAIDELKLHNISVGKLNEAIDKVDCLAEHWVKRAKFLSVIYANWQYILLDLSLLDDSIFEDIRIQTSELFKNFPNSPTIFQADDIFEEVNCIVEISEKNAGKTICAITPDKTFTMLLQEKLGNTIFIVHPRNFQKHNTDVVVLTNMVEQVWNYGCQGSYWLHDSIRKNLGLTTSRDEQEFAEYVFQYSIHKKKTFITFPLKINGINVKNSRILYRYMITHKCRPIKWTPRTYACKQICDSQEIRLQMPNKISAKDVELLANDPYDFYISKCLGLRPVSYDEKPHVLRSLYRTLIHGFLNNKRSVSEAALIDIANIDFYRYHHCKNVYLWVQRNCSFLQEQQNLKEVICEYELQGVKLHSEVDMIAGSKILFFRMFQTKIKANDILNGRSCAPMTTCLIARRSVGININELQIWDMHGLGEKPIDITHIEISDETVDFFEEKLKEILSSCVVNSRGKSERYSHFKRI